MNELTNKKKRVSKEDGDLEAQIRTDVEKNLTIKDYEMIYPKTIGYIKANIYHGYDSMYSITFSTTTSIIKKVGCIYYPWSIIMTHLLKQLFKSTSQQI